MRILCELSGKRIFGGSVVEMNRSSNGEEMKNRCRNLPGIDGKDWRSESVFGPGVPCAISPKTSLRTRKSELQLIGLDVSIRCVRGDGEEREASDS
jgi:hypothetical protein